MSELKLVWPFVLTGDYAAVIFSPGEDIVKVNGCGGQRSPCIGEWSVGHRGPSGVQEQSPVGGPGGKAPEAK